MNIIETEWEWKSGLSKRPKTQYIALHHSDAVRCTAQDIDRWHKDGNNWSGIGYHFFVAKDGTVYRGRPLWAMGAHVAYKNDVSIGICAEGDYSKEQTMPEAQKFAIVELLDYLKTYHYPNAKIVGHGEIGASACPGQYYPLDELKNYKKILNESEDLTMTQYEELKQEIAQLQQKLSEAETKIADRTGYYNYIDENMNKSYQPTIKRLVDEGIIHGNENGELMLTNDMMRVLVFVDRMLKKNT